MSSSTCTQREHGTLRHQAQEHPALDRRPRHHQVMQRIDTLTNRGTMTPHEAGVLAAKPGVLLRLGPDLRRDPPQGEAAALWRHDTKGAGEPVWARAVRGRLMIFLPKEHSESEHERPTAAQILGRLR